MWYTRLPSEWYSESSDLLVAKRLSSMEPKSRDRAPSFEISGRGRSGTSHSKKMSRRMNHSSSGRQTPSTPSTPAGAGMPLILTTPDTGNHPGSGARRKSVLRGSPRTIGNMISLSPPNTVVVLQSTDTKGTRRQSEAGQQFDRESGEIHSCGGKSCVRRASDQWADPKPAVVSSPSTPLHGTSCSPPQAHSLMKIFAESPHSATRDSPSQPPSPGQAGSSTASPRKQKDSRHNMLYLLLHSINCQASTSAGGAYLSFDLNFYLYIRYQSFRFSLPLSLSI